ncbi:hypothetical protein HD806DRAFT_527338 [Xylariaceae sp. AK1471]|nr:hypothetical protein HD806DRAFT_527338 [Xylariaceae sp. AK1471]
MPSLPETRERKRRQRMPTPITATIDADNLDLGRTPRWRSGKAWSTSNRTNSSRSSNTSRLSPTKRLAKLEVATQTTILVRQISRNDTRIPTELIIILGELDSFQDRVGIVPKYLAAEVNARAKDDDDFYNFVPSTFEQSDEGAANGVATMSDPQLCLHQVLKGFKSAKECRNEEHAEATWNTLTAESAPVHTDRSEGQDRDREQSREHQVRVRGMPCTAARLIGRAHGSKMVDYCIFVEPRAHEATKIDEVRERITYINHTDYNALRWRPTVLSAESMKASEGFRDAQLQLSVWQAAQWTLLVNLLTLRSTAVEGREEQPMVIPFLPALIIQGQEWYFTATTRSEEETVYALPQYCFMPAAERGHRAVVELLLVTGKADVEV